MTKKPADELRSARWFAPDDLRSFGHRSRFMQMGYGPADWAGKPVVAIVNTWSDVNPCHAHFKQSVEDVKRGVLQAGGFPVGQPGVLERIREHLHLDALTFNGRTLGDNIAGAEVYDDDVIRPLSNPIYAEGALAVLRGNLAPDGVVIKPSACAPHLLPHNGRALVYDATTRR
jgi:dihydroxyacid dehydratase/phosphogluconate dehydratase